MADPSEPSHYEELYTRVAELESYSQQLAKSYDAMRERVRELEAQLDGSRDARKELEAELEMWSTRMAEVAQIIRKPNCSMLRRIEEIAAVALP